MHPARVLTVHYESAPLIPVTIAGEQYQFLLDTGASITFIDRRLASRFKALTLSELPRAYQADFASVSSVSSQLGSEQLGIIEPQPLALRYGKALQLPKRKLCRDPLIKICSPSLSVAESTGMRTGSTQSAVSTREFDHDTHYSSRASLTCYRRLALFERCIGYEDSYYFCPAVYLTHYECSVRMYLDTGADQSYTEYAFIDVLKSQTERNLAKMRCFAEGLPSPSVYPKDLERHPDSKARRCNS